MSVPTSPRTAPPASTSSAGIAKLPSLTGYRFILFNAVFWTHTLAAARFFKNEDINDLGHIWPYGTTALTSFFILSGFVLTWGEAWRNGLARYWRARAAKIFPGHVAVWAFTLILLAVVGPMALIGPTDVGPAIANLFLVQAWIPNPSYMMSVYGINWSVSCEIAFYLALPLFIRPLLKIPAKALWGVFAGLVALILTIPALIDAFVGGPVWPFWAPLSFDQAWMVYFLPLSRLPEFLLGIVLARIVQTRQWPRIRARWIFLATVAATYLVWLAVDDVLPATYASSGVLSITVCLFIPLIALRDIDGRSSFLARKSWVTLGDASYATYLVHWPVLAIVRELAGPTEKYGLWAGLGIVLGTLVLTQAAGLALCRYVERPLMLRLGRPKKQQPTPTDRPLVGAKEPV
ncbi:acyltransferase family protein [Streptomyces sp. NPDC059524]|uniref:acyltransferase family protein n=1 Tax=Streptomyces sp. NPDC059524 TaxID=3346856 RepID=UPI00368CCD83